MIAASNGNKQMKSIKFNTAKILVKSVEISNSSNNNETMENDFGSFSMADEQQNITDIMAPIPSDALKMPSTILGPLMEEDDESVVDMNVADSRIASNLAMFKSSDAGSSTASSTSDIEMGSTDSDSSPIGIAIALETMPSTNSSSPQDADPVSLAPSLVESQHENPDQATAKIIPQLSNDGEQDNVAQPNTDSNQAETQTTTTTTTMNHQVNECVTTTRKKGGRPRGSKTAARMQCDDAAIRRSTRAKLDRFARPVYAYDLVEDFNGDLVNVCKVVEITRRPRYRDELYAKCMEKKKKSTTTTTAPKHSKSSEKVAPKAKQVEPKAIKPTQAKSTPKRQAKRRSLNDSARRHAALEARKKRTTKPSERQKEPSVRSSTRQRLIREGEQQQQQQNDKRRRLNEFTSFSPGVLVCIFDSRRALFKFDKAATLPASEHDKNCTYRVKQGSFVVWLNGELVRLNDGESISIPKSSIYKIRNRSKSNEALLMFNI